jgi:hypothetical protein
MCHFVFLDCNAINFLAHPFAWAHPLFVSGLAIGTSEEPTIGQPKKHFYIKMTDTATPHEQKITPWEVQGEVDADGKLKDIDYDVKLIHK